MPRFGNHVGIILEICVWVLETTRKRGENAMIETPTYNTNLQPKD
jgi:hypothetical protein